jgi:hypothetical protein
VMRAEVSSRLPPRSLCRHILSTILELSLPPQSQLQAFMDSIGIDKEHHPFSTIGVDKVESSVDSNYELRTRIHALNVLRLIILDAPMSKEVYPLIGDATSSSIIGYTDPEWGVRNSSTMVFAAIMLRSVDADKNASNSDTTSCKAASVMELFRSYPSLPAFLLAVLRGSLDGLFATDTSMSLPPVLPILLLMARIQPIAQSGADAVSLVEPFIPHILRCLEHRELSIRKTAARALSNLSSREESSTTSVGRLAELFEHRLSEVLQEMEDRSNCNWNKLHGTLLAILALSKSSLEAGDIIRGVLSDHAFFKLAWVESRKPTIHPVCILTSVEILSDLFDRSDSVSTRCVELITLLEEVHPTKAIIPGAGDLSSKVAGVATRTICSKLWGDKTTSNELKLLLNGLMRLLQSPCVDVRIAAVKAFKKETYDGLDETVERSRGCSEYARELIASVATMLTQALTSELRLGEESTKAHPPTLRRLSRCLLECLDAASRLGSLENTFQSIRADVLAASSAILSLHAGDRAYDPDSWTHLLGNATELLSFAIATDDSVDAARSAEFRALLGHISNPLCHWRVRYSAAAALERSCILEKGALSKHSDQIVLRKPIDLLFVWVNLLQDADEDVRFAATKVSTVAFVPEMTLVNSFRGANGFTNHFALLDFAFGRIAEITRDLDKRLTAVGVKYEESGRKIFEEEAPNSYCEVSLSCQLAIVAGTENAAQLSEDCVEKSEFLLKRCRTILSLMLRRKGSDSSVMHDTRSAGVFLPFHTLLVGCTCTIFLSEGDTSDTQVLAGKLLSTMGMLAHPCIQKALSALSLAQFHNDLTKKALLECCFLSRQLNSL